MNRVRSHCPLYTIVAAQAASVGKFMNRRRAPSTKNQSTATVVSTRTQSTTTAEANPSATLRPHTEWIMVQEDDES